MLTEAPPWYSDEARRAFRKGVAHGFAGQIKALLKILAYRELSVSKSQLRRIRECVGFATLYHWIDRAFTVGSVDELLTSPSSARQGDPGFDEAFLEGKAKAYAETVLKLLAQRGLTVGSDQQEEIEQCQDLATLEHWLDGAFTASSVDDLLG